MNSFRTARCLEGCIKDLTSLPKSCWILCEVDQEVGESLKPFLKYMKKTTKKARAATSLPDFRCIAFEGMTMVVEMSGCVGVLAALRL